MILEICWNRWILMNCGDGRSNFLWFYISLQSFKLSNQLVTGPSWPHHFAASPHGNAGRIGARTAGSLWRGAGCSGVGIWWFRDFWYILVELQAAKLRWSLALNHHSSSFSISLFKYRSLHLSGLRLAECIAEQWQSLWPGVGCKDCAGSAQERGWKMPHLRPSHQAGAAGLGWISQKIGYLYIYIAILVYIYTHDYFMCKSGFPSHEHQLVADFGSVGPDPKIYEKKTTRLRWLEDSLHRELHHLLEGSKRDSPEMGISSQSICRLVWNPCARW